MRAAVPAWDGFDAYLFDIDGTLLHCRDAVHYFAFCETLSAMARQPVNLDGVTAHGNTDVGILRDALALAGVAEERWRPCLAQMREAMAERVRARKHEICAEVLPGVVAILDHLHTRGAALGVASGNLKAIGELKLQRAGLSQYFSFAGWSDACEQRAEIFRGAAEAARSIAGQHASICVVGDTPSDIIAARANGLAVVAVATGIYPVERLRAENPEWCVGCLEELRQACSPLPA